MLYIAVATVLLGIVPYGELMVADPLAVGIDATGLRWLSPVIKICRCAVRPLRARCSSPSSGRLCIFYSMSRDGLLPPVFGRVHPRLRTPYLSTIMTAVIVALVSGLTPIEMLGQLVSIGTLFAFVLVSLGVIILRRTAPDLPRPFRAPGVPFVPIAGAVVCFLQMVGLPAATWERLVIWLAVGLVVYFGYGHRHAVVGRARSVISAESTSARRG